MINFSIPIWIWCQHILPSKKYALAILAPWMMYNVSKVNAVWSISCTCTHLVVFIFTIYIQIALTLCVFCFSWKFAQSEISINTSFTLCYSFILSKVVAQSVKRTKWNCTIWGLPVQIWINYHWKKLLTKCVRFKNSVLTTFPNLVKIDETLGITTVMLCWSSVSELWSEHIQKSLQSLAPNGIFYKDLL